MNRYPWANADAILRARGVTTNYGQAEYLGIDRRYLARIRREGVTATKTEVIAKALGYLDYEVWPEMLEEAIAVVERECAAEDCAERFVPPARAPRKQYCSPTCQKRIQGRKQYRKHRDRILASVAQYDAEARELKRRYSRSYYRRNRERLLAAQRERDRRRAGRAA